MISVNRLIQVTVIENTGLRRIMKKILLVDDEESIHLLYREELEEKGYFEQILIDKDLLVKERFEGGYSLTQTGFTTMNECVPHADV